MPKKERILFNDVSGQLAGELKKGHRIFEKLFGKTNELIERIKKSFKESKDKNDTSTEISDTLRSSLEKIPLIGK
jgi:hypothetical protein